MWMCLGRTMIAKEIFSEESPCSIAAGPAQRIHALPRRASHPQLSAMGIKITKRTALFEQLQAHTGFVQKKLFGRTQKACLRHAEECERRAKTALSADAIKD